MAPRCPYYKAYEAPARPHGRHAAQHLRERQYRVSTRRAIRTLAKSRSGASISPTPPTPRLKLALTNLNAGGYDAKLYTLRTATGPTTLISSNLPVYLPGGPTNGITWREGTLSGTDFGNYTMSLPAATISLLILNPIYMAGDFNRDGRVDAADYVIARKLVLLPATSRHGVQSLAPSPAKAVTVQQPCPSRGSQC